MPDGFPRLQNEEADQLTNGEFHNFDPKKRIPVEELEAIELNRNPLLRVEIMEFPVGELVRLLILQSGKPSGTQNQPPPPPHVMRQLHQDDAQWVFGGQHLIEEVGVRLVIGPARQRDQGRQVAAMDSLGH